MGWKNNKVEFLKLIEHLDGLTGTDAVHCSLVTDHEKSFSIYFADPYGNQLGVTTYESDSSGPITMTVCDSVQSFSFLE
jgi:hypothetical protein